MSLVPSLPGFHFRLLSLVLAFVLTLGCVLSGGDDGSSSPLGGGAAVPSGPGATVISGPSAPGTLVPFGLPEGLPTSSPGVSEPEAPTLVGSEPVSPTAVSPTSVTPGVVVIGEPGPGATVGPAPTALPAPEVFVPTPTRGLGETVGVLLDEAGQKSSSGGPPAEIQLASVDSESRSSGVFLPAGGSSIPPEAGGLVNPNDALLPLVYFEGYGVNPFVDVDEDPLSTFSLDGDTASFEIAKLYLQGGGLPPEDSVRVEEWVNSFDQGYPEVESGLGLFLDGGPSPFGDEGYRLVRVGVGAQALPDEREAVNLVVVLDVSGSMSADSRIGVAKDLIVGILDDVRAQDRVAVVTYGDTVQVLHPFVSGSEVGSLKSSVLEIVPNGATYVEAGIRKAYELAALESGRAARIVVISDGVGNLGATGAGSILEFVDGNARRNTVLSTIGVGTSGNYNDVMLEVLANRGNGTYHYIQRSDSLDEFLANQVTGIFTEVARDARIQVEFNPDVVRKYRLIGYENRAVADEDFRDDSLDFGELGFARDVTALYELRLFDDVEDDAELLTAYLRWMDAGEGEVVEVNESLVFGDLAGDVADLPYEFRRAAGVAEFAELLRRSFWAQCGTLDEVGELLGFRDRDDSVLDRMVLDARNHFSPFCKR